MDGIIAYVLSKGYTDEKVAGLGNVFNYKGTVPAVEDLPATGNKAGDVYTVTSTGSEYVWVTTPTAHWELLGSAIGPGKYSTTITGDGTTTEFVITHNLNSRDVVAVVYGSADYNETTVSVQHTTVDSLKLTFGTAPAAEATYVVSVLIPQGPTGPQGPQGPKGEDGANTVSVSATGTSTNEVNYITINGVESKLAGGSDVSVSATGTSTNLVKYITIDGTESKMGMDISVSASGSSTNDVRYITIDGTESRFSAVALKAMKSAWVTGTTLEAANAILADDSVVQGDGFLATVYWSDLPGELTQAEVKAFVMKKGSSSYQRIIQFECTSGTVAPYSWFYNSYEKVWRSQVPLNTTLTSEADNEALAASMGKSLQDQINNLKNIGRFLSIWNASTGAPTSEPSVSPYSYKVGDYYRVGVAGTKNPAHNSKYTTGGTNWVTGDELEVGDVVYVSNIEGNTSTWVVEAKGGSGEVQDVQINGTTIVGSETGIANIPLADSNTNGAMSSTQAEKLAGVASNAEVNILETVQINGTDLEVFNKKTNIPLASTSVNGAMSFQDKTKLAGIEANADVTDATNVAAAGAIMKTAQSLTDAEKTQARANIGAVALQEYNASAASYEANTLYYVVE